MRWTLTHISFFWVNSDKILDLTTDIPCHLWLLWSTIPPKRELAHPARRGNYCRIGEFLWPWPLGTIEQNEGGLTPNHSFIWADWPLGQTRFYTFYPDPAATPGHSTCAVFSQTGPEAPPVPVSFERYFFQFRPNGPPIDPWELGHCTGPDAFYLTDSLRLPCPAPFTTTTIVSIDPANLQYSITRSYVQATPAFMCMISLCTTKTTTSSPQAEPDGYHMILMRAPAMLLIRRVLGGVLTQLYFAPSIANPENLTIEIMFDAIYFYQRGRLAFTEPYLLPSYDLYTYLWAWSDAAQVGTNIQIDTLLHRVW